MALDFDFTEEQEKLRQEVREFALKELAPNADYWDEHEVLPWEAIGKMGEKGFQGLAMPKKLGGSEQGFVSAGIACEELARGDIVCAFVQGAVSGWGPCPDGIKDWWGDDFLRDVVKGKKLFAVGSSEPGAGSDAASEKTSAVREGDEYVINGVKRFISFVPGATIMGTSCQTAPKKGLFGVSWIKVELDRPGVTITSIPEMGLRGHQLGNIVLKDVRVPVSNRMAEEHRGLYAVFNRWGLMRIYNTMYPLGAAMQSIDETIEWVKRRVAFGRPIGKFEAVQFRIVEDYTNIELTRLMAYRGLWLADKGRLPNIREAAMVKHFGQQACARAIDNCLQNHGAYGYQSDKPFDRRYRAVRGFQLGNGTNDIMKIMLGRLILGEEMVPYR